MTTLRSEAKVDSFCIGTCNPDPDSWVLQLIEYYIDEEGMPIEERCGEIRHFIVKDGHDFIFGPSEDFFKENYPESVYVNIPGTEEIIYIRPKTFTYIFFNIFDNPIGLKANPAYLSELNNLPDHERNTQLWGNWRSRPKGSSLWSRAWIRGDNGEKVKKYTDLPKGLKWYRAWDKGYSEVSDVNRYPDFTAASPKIAKDDSGQYWLLGEYHSTVFSYLDKDTTESSKVYGKFRRLAGERDSLIINQGIHDGSDTTTVLTRDAGAGYTDHMYTKSRLIENEVKVAEDSQPKNTPSKKLKDFAPFANACEIGLVNIVEESFPNAKTLEAWYKEIEAFDPALRSSGSRKDDWVDATASAFNMAASQRTIKIIQRNQKDCSTISRELLKNKSGEFK